MSDAEHGGLKYSLFLDPREKQIQTWVMGPSSGAEREEREREREKEKERGEREREREREERGESE